MLGPFLGLLGGFFGHCPLVECFADGRARGVQRPAGNPAAVGGRDDRRAPQAVRIAPEQVY